MAEKAIERFDFDATYCCCLPERVVKPDGEYVYADDIAEILRDAMRYRHLRDSDDERFEVTQWLPDERGDVQQILFGHQLDTAIDTAISQSEGAQR